MNAPLTEIAITLQHQVISPISDLIHTPLVVHFVGFNEAQALGIRPTNSIGETIDPTSSAAQVITVNYGNKSSKDRIKKAETMTQGRTNAILILSTIGISTTKFHQTMREHVYFMSLDEAQVLDHITLFAALTMMAFHTTPGILPVLQATGDPSQALVHTADLLQSLLRQNSELPSLAPKHLLTRGNLMKHPVQGANNALINFACNQQLFFNDPHSVNLTSAHQARITTNSILSRMTQPKQCIRIAATLAKIIKHIVRWEKTSEDSLSHLWNTGGSNDDPLTPSSPSDSAFKDSFSNLDSIKEITLSLNFMEATQHAISHYIFSQSPSFLDHELSWENSLNKLSAYPPIILLLCTNFRLDPTHAAFVRDSLYSFFTS